MDVLPEWQRELQGLLDTDPSEAVRRARGLDQYTGPVKAHVDEFRAGILIDAGEAAREGIAIVLGLVDQGPNSHLYYKLANGYAALVNCTDYADPTWWLKTSDDRMAARAGYRRALSTTDPLLAARCRANLANQTRHPGYELSQRRRKRVE